MAERRQLPGSDSQVSRVTKVSRALAGVRWAYMPVGLLALIAVGVHAAADAIDDRILWAVDQVDALFDAVFGAFKATSGLVDFVGFEQRVTVARGLALLWELSVDLILALPALGYHEREVRVRPLDLALHPEKTGPFKAMVRRVRTHPTTLRLIRPLASAAVVLAGACAVARMVQGQVYLSGRLLIGDGAAGIAARVLAIAVLGLVLYALGWRAVLRNLEHADELSREATGSRRRALLDGIWGSVLVLPLAWTALWDASPVLSFFR